MKRLGELLSRHGVPLLLLVLSIALRIWNPAPVQDIQNRVFDNFQRMRPRAYENVPVRVIDIDDASLSRLGQWPWPRTLVSRLVERLAALGTSTIAFDVMFAEPDRTSPGRVLSSWPQIPEVKSLKARAKSLPDHDALLAKTFAAANVVTGFSLSFDEGGRAPGVKAGFAHGGDSPLSYLQDFPGSVVNLPELEDAAAGNGSLSFIPDRDGVIRRAHTLFRRGNSLLPALALEALRAAQGAANYAVKCSGASGEASYGEHTGIVSIKVGQFTIPTDGHGRFWVYYAKEAPARTVPAWKVLEKDFPGRELEGAIVFVGASAAGLKDLRTTPLNPAAAGVDVHASIVEQVLQGRYINRPDWAAGAELCYLLVLGLALLALLHRVGAAWCAGLSLLAVAGAFALSWHAFTAWGMLLDPLFPSIVVAAVYASSSLLSYLRTEREKREIRGAFGRYLSPVLVEQLAKHPEKLVLGGELRNITVHFCDIRGFTTISEQFDAHGLTNFINRFLTPMTEIILANKGTIDKYIGDCIMAYWNAPLDDPDHAANACRAALNMHRRLGALNAQMEEESKAGGHKFIPIHIGTGLNTGKCVVGNLGSEQRFDYSCLGDGVNLASRLEGQSKTYGAQIVLGPNTREAAPGFAALELDLIKVKGKTQPVRIYTLLGDETIAKTPSFLKQQKTHDDFLGAYRRQAWDDAERIMPQGRRGDFHLDTLYDLYASRIAEFRAHPPGGDWDGVFTATTK